MYKYMKRAHKHKYSYIHIRVDICVLMESQIARGYHYHNACTTSCNGGQNALTDIFQKFLSLHSIGITVLGFSANDLDQFYSKYQRDIVA